MNLQPEEYARQVLFQNVDYEEVRECLENSTLLTLEEGDLLLHPEQINAHLYLILTGKLSVHLNAPDTPAISYILEGACTGELSAVDEEMPSAFVKADQPTRILQIARTEMNALFKRSHTFTFNLLRIFTQRMRFNTEALVESRFVRTVPDVIYRLDNKGRFIFLNESIKTLGYEAEELLGQHFTVLIDEQDLENVSYDRVIEKIRETGKPPTVQPKLFDEHRSNDRKTAGLEVHLKVGDPELTSDDAEGVVPEGMIVADVSCTGLTQNLATSKFDEYIGTIGIIRDVTERKVFQARIAEQKARMEAIFDGMADALVIVDTHGIIESVNAATTAIFGYPEEELIGSNLRCLLPEMPEVDQASSGNQLFSREILTDTEHANRGETLGRSKEGGTFHLEITVTDVQLRQGILFTCIMRDITARKEAERIIHYQANYDALTDLPNRSLFMKQLKEAVAAAKATDTSFAVAFIDLDRFKWVNDSLGHPAGDELLIMSSKRVASVVKGKDSVARLGGDEFTAILQDVGNDTDAAGIAMRILEQLNLPFILEEEEVFISGSLGVALYPQDAQDVDSLLKNADEAMYRSKKAGRNAYHLYTGASKQLPKNY
ncbi:MAG: diguanylate cyclase [Magnetococcales bacterium]|nr:diguanylate cyclase [Magnetococcales bacterium]